LGKSGWRLVTGDWQILPRIKSGWRLATGHWQICRRDFNYHLKPGHLLIANQPVARSNSISIENY